MPRLIDAPLDISFERFCDNENMLREFNSLAQSDEDPVGQWLKLARARGETSESDQVLLTLLVELHRKVDALSSYVKNEQTEYVKLSCDKQIDKIGFEYFLIKDADLKNGEEYYGRIAMPIFPKREVPLFFTCEEKNLAKITKMHERDVKDWNSYVTARERVMIRQIKAKQ